MEFELNPPKLGKIESVGESCSGLDRTESTVNGADMVGRRDFHRNPSREQDGEIRGERESGRGEYCIKRL